MGRTMRSRVSLFLLAAITAVAVVGCAELLPKSAVRTEVQWETFDDARALVNSIQPYKTTKADLAGLGLSAAWAAQSAVGLLAALAVWRTWTSSRRPSRLPASSSAFLQGSLLPNPQLKPVSRSVAHNSMK